MARAQLTIILETTKPTTNHPIEAQQQRTEKKYEKQDNKTKPELDAQLCNIYIS